MNASLQKQAPKTPAYYFYCLVGICFAYLVFEYFFIPFGALSADEFVFGRHIYEYTYHMPYRDFAPYKTVLGYYLLSLPLYFSHAFLAPLFYIKDEIALCNVCFIATAYYLGLRLFTPKALLLATLAILANQLFLVYSSDLRVDMLCSWVCLLAVLYVLQQRFYLAGSLMSLAFLVSQKALWYVIAVNGAMVLCFIAAYQSIYSPRALLKFNLALLLPIGLYILFWSLFASPAAILQNLFYEAYIQAKITWYVPIYFTCWQVVLTHGPTLFFLWPFTFITLFDKSQNAVSLDKTIFILSFASIALLQLIHYQQAFPYNFVFTVPAFFLLYAHFFTWFSPEKTFSLSAWSTLLWLFYSLSMLALVYFFNLPAAYYLIPLFTVAVLNKRCYALAAGVFIFAGIVIPFIHSLQTSTRIDGSYQHTMLKIANELLEKEEGYVAGIPFLFQKDQPVTGMKNLIGPAIAYLHTQDETLTPLLLPSLYLAPVTSESVLEEMEKNPVKLYLNNYRIEHLPVSIATYLKRNYQHFYGSIYLYAPEITPEQLSFFLKFTGDYRVQMPAKSRAKLDNKSIRNGYIIHLSAGDHVTYALHAYRLVLTPKPLGLEKNPLPDQWVRMIKAIIS